MKRELSLNRPCSAGQAAPDSGCVATLKTEDLAPPSSLWHDSVVNRAVRVAAGLLWCYAGLLVVEAVAVGVGRHWTDRKHLVLHLLGALGVFLLARAVLRGRRWAGLIVVIVGGALSLLGLTSLLIVFFSPVSVRRDIAKGMMELYQLGSLSVPLGLLSLAVLAGSVALLLTKQARDVFFPRSRRR